MNDFKKYVREFCDNHEKCTIYEGYSPKWMGGDSCIAIIIKDGYSPIDVMGELGDFLEGKDFDRDALTGTDTDVLGDDELLYFPYSEC